MVGNREIYLLTQEGQPMKLSPTIQKTTLPWITIMAVLITTFAATGMAWAAQTAVVATVDSAWTAGALSVISVDKTEGARSVSNKVNPIGNTDVAVAAFGDSFYRMERMDYNNVTKFAVNDPKTIIYQYSCQGEDSAPANPHDLVFLSEEKAYLLRYGSTKAWIVNPSATTREAFKIGEIDFGSYADADGIPEMNTGVIVDGKLYVNLQRIDFSGGWGNYVYHTSYVAVIDTDTDTEIDTGKGTGAMKGIPVGITNSGTTTYLPENGLIYIQGSGSTDDLKGGVVSLDPATFTVSQIVDDDTQGDGNALYGGRIFGMAIVSRTTGFFVAYHAWGDCSVYEFNPETGAVTGTVADLEHLDIAGMANGIYVDENQMLWVNSGTAGGADEPEIIIYDPSTDTIDERIQTVFSPGATVFCGTASDYEKENDDGGSDGLCFIETGREGVNGSGWGLFCITLFVPFLIMGKKHG